MGPDQNTSSKRSSIAAQMLDEETLRRLESGELYSPYAMSVGVFVPNWLLRPDIPSSCAILYGILARHERGNGCCWPGRETLAEELGKSVDTVDRALSQMAELGLIEIHKVKGKRNVYVFPANVLPLKRPQTSRKMRPLEDDDDQPQNAAPRKMRPAAESRVSSRKSAGDTAPPILNERNKRKTGREGFRPLPARDEWFDLERFRPLARDLEFPDRYVVFLADEFEEHWRNTNQTRKDWALSFQKWMRKDFGMHPGRAQRFVKIKPVVRETLSIFDTPDRVAPPLPEIARVV